MIKTRPATMLDFPYPTVHYVANKIGELERELKSILDKEKHLVASVKHLYLQPQNEAVKRELTELEVLVVSNKSQKDTTAGMLQAFREELPKKRKEAKKNEAALNAKKKEVENLKIKIKEIDKELASSLKGPMKLIEKRKETILNFNKSRGKILDLTRALRWNSPKQDESISEPAILLELQELFPVRTVRWRGRG